LACKNLKTILTISGTQCLEQGKDCPGYKTTLTSGVGVSSRGQVRGLSLLTTNSMQKASQNSVTTHFDPISLSPNRDLYLYGQAPIVDPSQSAIGFVHNNSAGGATEVPLERLTVSDQNKPLDPFGWDHIFQDDPRTKLGKAYVNSMPSDMALTQTGRIVNSPKELRCWDHGCNGRAFSTHSNYLRHQRWKNGQAGKHACPRCGALFTRKTAMNGHMLLDKCRRLTSQYSPTHSSATAKAFGTPANRASGSFVKKGKLEVMDNEVEKQISPGERSQVTCDVDNATPGISDLYPHSHSRSHSPDRSQKRPRLSTHEPEAERDIPPDGLDSVGPKSRLNTLVARESQEKKQMSMDMLEVAPVAESQQRQDFAATTVSSMAINQALIVGPPRDTDFEATAFVPKFERTTLDHFPDELYLPQDRGASHFIFYDAEDDISKEHEQNSAEEHSDHVIKHLLAQWTTLSSNDINEAEGIHLNI
jgi:hypothetical protein